MGVDIGDIEAESIDQFQNTGYTSGNIFKPEFDEDDAGIRRIILQISDLLQLCVRFSDLFLRSLHIQKQHMAVYGFIIADPGNVDAQRRKTFAGLQKGTDMIRHRSYICLFHCSFTTGIDSQSSLHLTIASVILLSTCTPF